MFDQEKKEEGIDTVSEALASKEVSIYKRAAKPFLTSEEIYWEMRAKKRSKNKDKKNMVAIPVDKIHIQFLFACPLVFTDFDTEQ